MRKAVDSPAAVQFNREHNERLRHQNTNLSERLSEVLGAQVVHDAGLTRTDEIGTLRERVTELEQELLDRRQDLQGRNDELTAAPPTAT
jgi:polyhydroxyalkanoate synthesis regulator phasin